jgi:hypothetical protein
VGACLAVVDLTGSHWVLASGKQSPISGRPDRDRSRVAGVTGQSYPDKNLLSLKQFLSSWCYGCACWFFEGVGGPSTCRPSQPDFG